VVRFRAMADENKDGKKGGGLSDLVKAESMLQLALALPGGVLIGALAGTALDKHFQTHWMAVVGILLGAAAGFTQIFKMAARAMRKDN